MEDFEYATLVWDVTNEGEASDFERNLTPAISSGSTTRGKDIPRNNPDDDLTRREEGVRVPSNSQGLITSTKQSQRIPSMHQKPAIVICFNSRKSNVDKSSLHSNLLDVLLDDMAVGRVVFGVGSA